MKQASHKYGLSDYLPTVVFLSIIVCFLSIPVLQQWCLEDSDSFFHLRIGDEILASGHVPTTEFLSHTFAGAPFIVHWWGADVIFALLYRIFGLDSFLFYTSIMCGLIGFLTIKKSLTNKVLPLASVLGLVVTGYLLKTGIYARPHLFSWLGFAIGMIALEKEVWRRRHWTTPLLFASGMSIWVNLHPGCWIFLGLLVVEFAAVTFHAIFRRQSLAEVKWAWFIFLFSFLGCILNPYGLRPAIAVLGFASDPGFKEVIPEHMPIWNYPRPAAVFVFALIISLYSLFFTKVRRRPGALPTMAAIALLSFSAIRHVQLFAIVSSGFVGLGLQSILQEYFGYGKGSSSYSADKKFYKSKLTQAIAMMAGAGLCALVLQTAERPFLSDAYEGSANMPFKAVEFIRRNLDKVGERAFNSYAFGGYLEYALPEKKTYIDSRADFFGSKFILQEIKFEKAINDDLYGDFLKEMEHYKVDWAIVPPNLRLGNWLADAGWSSLYLDTKAQVFVKSGRP